MPISIWYILAKQQMIFYIDILKKTSYYNISVSYVNFHQKVVCDGNSMIGFITSSPLLCPQLIICFLVQFCGLLFLIYMEKQYRWSQATWTLSNLLRVTSLMTILQVMSVFALNWLMSCQNGFPAIHLSFPEIASISQTSLVKMMSVLVIA